MVQEKKSTDLFPWVLMILMSSVTFVGILSELVPSGVLPQIMEDLGVNEVQGGRMVGLYALASAIFGILSKQQWFAMLYIDGMLFPTVSGVYRLISTVIEDHAVLQNLA